MMTMISDPSFHSLVMNILTITFLYLIATGIGESQQQLKRLADEADRRRGLEQTLNEEFNELYDFADNKQQ